MACPINQTGHPTAAEWLTWEDWPVIEHFRLPPSVVDAMPATEVEQMQAFLGLQRALEARALDKQR